MALNTIRNLYKFYYTHPTKGQLECFPANNKIEFTWKKDKDQLFFRKELNSTLKFVKDDFTDLYNIDRSNYRCEKLFFEAHRSDGLSFDLFWSGYIALIDAEFDVDRCEVSVKPRLSDNYSCLLNNWNTEKDFIVGCNRLNGVRFTVGEIEFLTCTAEIRPIFIPGNALNAAIQTPITSCLTEPYEGWFFIGNHFTSEISYSGFYFLESRYGREFILRSFAVHGITPPPGVGWIIISITGDEVKWVRPLSVSSDALYLNPLQNGRKLNDVLKFLLADCDLTIVSDFFNINPDNTHPDNIAYDYADNFLHEVVIFQKSDIRRTNKRNVNGTALDVDYATHAYIKLKNFLEFLRVIYNVHWSVEENVFRIEHYTYFTEGSLMLDLTIQNRNILAGLHKYNYKKESLPGKETWKWMEITDTVNDFDGLPVTYNSECSFDKEGKDIEYNAEQVTTNVEFIINNPDKIADSGFVLVATEYNTIITDIGLISGKIKINAPHAFANLQYHLHRHGRPQKYGNMNGSDETFYNVNKTRSQPEISFKISTDDLTLFNPIDKVKTQLGWGNVEQATLSDPENVMKISLIHD
jgi:hypothetical protein